MGGDSWGEASSSGSESEEDLDVSKQVAILIIGRSGSGKTYLTKSLIDQFKQEGKPTYVVNDRTNDNTFRKIDWERLNSLSDCALVFEDVIACRQSQFVLLQEMLNFRSHHARVTPIIVIAHALLRNNIHGLLPYFNFIYIAAVKTNVTSFRKLLTTYAFDKEEQNKYLSQFLAANEQFTFFMFDIEKRKIRLTRAEDSVRREEENARLLKIERELAEPRRIKETAFASAKKYLSKMRENSDYAIILFELIYPFLPLERLDPDHLTVSLLKEGNPVTVSVIDYISALLDQRQTEPDYYILQFHRYLKRKRRLHLPKTYILNRHFWG